MVAGMGKRRRRLLSTGDHKTHGTLNELQSDHVIDRRCFLCDSRFVIYMPNGFVATHLADSIYLGGFASGSAGPGEKEERSIREQLETK